MICPVSSASKYTASRFRVPSGLVDPRVFHNESNTMLRVHIDFETRSLLPIADYGVSKYAQDLSTEVLCMGYAIDGGEVQLWTPKQQFPVFPKKAIYVAHNATFELSIVQHVLHAMGVMGIPYDAAQWECTAARAVYYGIDRGLGAAAKRVLGPSFQKDPKGDELIKLLCVPMKNGTFNDDPEMLQRLYDYCKQDVVVERELDKVLPPLPDMERIAWRLNHECNQRGMPIDRGYCEGSHQVVLSAGADLGGQLYELTYDGIDDPKKSATVKTPKQTAKMLQFLNRQGVNIGNLQAATVTEALKDQGLPEAARKVLEIRQIGSSAAVGKLPTIVRLCEKDDRIRGAFTYYGADASGRFSSWGAQFHNWKKMKEGEYPDSYREALASGDADLVRMFYHAPMQLAGDTIRWAIKAPKGRVFAISDLSQIECRILHWFAGNKKMLDMFRFGHDPYKELACKVYNTTLERVNEEQRSVCKTIILAGGYGQGAKRFQAFAEQAGLVISPVFAKKVVDAYREDNPLVTKLWANMEQACVTCVKTGRSFSGSRLKFHMEQGIFVMTLPSGRRIHFHDAKIAGEGRDTRLQYYSPRFGIRREWAGGLLTALCCQGTARDVLVHGWDLASRAGLDILGTIHDELIAEVDEAHAETELAKLVDCMTTVPDWAEGIPLAADGRIRKRLTK